jgi:hypothetical protein
VRAVTAREIERLEHELMTAIQQRDRTTLERLLGERFVLVTGRPGHEVRTRSEWLAVTMTDYVIEEFAFDTLEVDVYEGAAVARSRYRQRGRMGPADRTQPFLMTDVWIRGGVSWRIVARHITPLPPGS